MGGAAFLGRANFTLAQLNVHDNSAHLGGGLYVAADLSLPAELQYLQLRNNVADMGQGIFWCVRADVRGVAAANPVPLGAGCAATPQQSPPCPSLRRLRSKSPSVALSCEGCSGQGLSTEVLTMQFGESAAMMAVGRVWRGAEESDDHATERGVMMAEPQTAAASQCNFPHHGPLCRRRTTYERAVKPRHFSVQDYPPGLLQHDGNGSPGHLRGVG